MIYSPRKSGWAQSSVKKDCDKFAFKSSNFSQDRSLVKSHHSSVVFRFGWSRISAPLSSRPKFQYVEPYCRPNFGGFSGKSPHFVSQGRLFKKDAILFRRSTPLHSRRGPPFPWSHHWPCASTSSSSTRWRSSPSPTTAATLRRR